MSAMEPEEAAWRAFLVAAGYAGDTVRTYVGAAKRFGASLDDASPIVAALCADHDDVAGWLGRAVSHYAARAACRGLRQLYAWALQEGYVDEDPTAGLAPIRSPRRPRTETEEAALALQARLEPADDPARTACSRRLVRLGVGDEPLLDGWVRSMVWADRSDRTVYQFVQVVQAFGRWLDVAQPVKAVLGADRSDIESWMLERGIAAGSRKNYLTALTSFYRWAVDEGHLDESPTRRIAKPMVRSTMPRPVSHEDLVCAVDAATEPTLRLMLLAGALAGLRRAEIAFLRAEHVGSESVLVAGLGAKGGHERHVPTHPDVLEAVHALGRPAKGWLFPSQRDDLPLRPFSVGQRVSNHFSRLGIAATCHQLRHYFASEVYRSSGGDLVLVQRLLGHASVATTQIYAAPRTDATSAVAALGLRRQ